ncbi:MAG: hypothetical protein ACODAU_04160 [Myxococcota bacterium]
MADQPKKRRNIKDLKARLGKTIAPQQGGGGGAVPPPNLGAGGGAPGAGKSGGPAFPGADVAPPPFLQKKKKRQAADPFAAGEAPAEGGPREVRLVVDDKPVEDSEVGRVQRFRTILIAVGVALVAIGVGYGAGSTMAGRQQYNAAVRDGKDIFRKIQEASDTVQKTNRLVNQALSAAKGGPGKDPKVAYDAIEQIRSIEQPFSASDFARKKYQLFKPATVDSLFDYYNKVITAWDKFEGLAATTLPKQRRAVLDKSAEAAGEMSSMRTGCVPDVVEEQHVCGLVYVHPREEGDKLKPGEINVSLNPTGRTFAKKVFTGQSLGDNASDYVIITDTERSVGVLGKRASEFSEYQRDLMDLKEHMEATMETQGRLERELGEVASLEEVFAL